MPEFTSMVEAAFGGGPLLAIPGKDALAATAKDTSDEVAVSIEFDNESR